MNDTFEIPDDATPGDLFRKIAEFYDAHPDLKMPIVNLGDHSYRRDPRPQEYVDAFAERFGLEKQVQQRDGTRMVYDRLQLILAGGNSYQPGTVHLNVFGPDRDI